MPSESAELRLRPAGPEDAEALATLYLAAREAAYPSMPRAVHGPDSVRSRFHEVLDPGGAASRETWVAEEPEGDAAAAPVGFLLLDGGWLHSLYVRPGETGRGVGSVLLDLTKSLRPDGFGLWVFESNVRARAFYHRHGLVTLRRTDGSGNEERAPDREMAWLGADPVAALRRRVDDADERLAELLAQRLELTALIQQHKPVPGEAGRDARREQEIVERMARAAPRLGAARLRRIMDAVIGESLDAAREEQPPPT